jgi:hypothetical protein
MAWYEAVLAALAIWLVIAVVVAFVFGRLLAPRNWRGQRVNRSG